MTQADEATGIERVPTHALAAFRGENPNGTWTLNVSDRAPFGTGTVRDFSLLLDGYTCERAVGPPDLSLSMSAGPDPAEVDSELLYTIMVSNGQNVSTGVRLTDALPANVSFISADASQGSCARAGANVVCDIGTLRAYGLAVVTVRVKPTTPGPITNTASATSNESDADQTNNTTARTVTATRTADLILTNIDTPDPIPVGATTTYNIKVTNRGPSPATGVVITARNDAGAVQTFNVGDLAVNASRTVTTSGAGASFGTIATTATVTANETDPRPDNNVAAQNTRVVTVQKFKINRAGGLVIHGPIEVPGCPSTDAGALRGELYLTSAAPVGGALVTLTSANSKLIVPPTVTVEAGNSYAGFRMAVNSTVEQPVSGEITATYAGTSKTLTVTVRPISVTYIVTADSILVGGGSANYTARMCCKNCL